jgi:hypothetical protein
MRLQQLPARSQNKERMRVGGEPFRRGLHFMPNAGHAPPFARVEIAQFNGAPYDW